jgi:hypothetical protein
MRQQPDPPTFAVAAIATGRGVVKAEHPTSGDESRRCRTTSELQVNSDAWELTTAVTDVRA